METIQAIRSRRSIRKYQQKPVPHEVIEQIVADAAYAPSWKNTQIARYVLVEDRTTIDKMAEEMVRADILSCRVGARRRHGHHGLLRRREDHGTFEPAGESEGRLCDRPWLSR